MRDRYAECIEATSRVGAGPREIGGNNIGTAGWPLAARALRRERSSGEPGRWL